MSPVYKLFESVLPEINLTVVVFILSLSAVIVPRVMVSHLFGIGKLNGSDLPFYETTVAGIF